MLYNEIMNARSSSRPYRKVERARREEETRRRITEAAVELHRTLGPSNTTVSELAKLAGVSRMTVYNHFPTEVDLFTACSTHWATRNPFPDPARWAEIRDPCERLDSALEELYGWYALKEDMLGNVFRDVAILPALAQVMGDLWSTYVDQLVATLSEGWTEQEAGPETLEAALRLGVDFGTWQTLTEAGLDHDRAAKLSAGMVIGACGVSEPA